MEKKSFKPSLEAVQKIQDFVEDNIKGEKSDKKLFFKLNILIEEIVVNIVNYAFEDTDKGIIDIEIETSDGEICLRISDNGLPFNPLEVEEPDINAPLENRKPGGLGIFFVKQIAKSIEYSFKNSKNCIHLILKP